MSGQPSVDLQSREHRALFDIIDKLRSHGIDQHVDLPQIIVCGDQSAGKSSVLEAISGHPFPTKDGLCTRFVTELVLRREPKYRFNVSIKAGPERSHSDAARLHHFSETVSCDARLDEVIEQAKEVMGLSSTKRFSSDVLRVEISGPDQAHLTMVDLPGLFRAGSSAQSVEDVKTVERMVRNAMARPRSIVLAVVSASNEFNNQEVTELARELDPSRVRTLGLITEPDKLDEGSESEKSYVKLARNQDVVLNLGWHVLRNRGHEMNGCSAAARDDVEREFFSRGAWRSVDPSHLGVVSLRKRLSEVLGRQILRHLPALRDEVASRIRECELTLEKLGDSRETSEQQRRYLLGVSRRFTSLMTAAVEGNYNDVFFGDADLDEEYWKRIRVVVQNTLRDFAKRMHREGKHQNIIDDNQEYSDSPLSPVLRSVYLNRVIRLMERSRGRELQGMFNPLIVRDLFVEQCRPWKRIAAETTASVVEAVARTALVILRYVALEKTLGGISAIVNEGIEKFKREVDDKVNELLAPHYEGLPITYNYYLMGMVQKAQSQRRARVLEGIIASSMVNDNSRASLAKARKGSSDNGITYAHDVAALCTQFESKLLEPDMEKQASSQAVDYSEAYYKVAMKRFIDEVSILAVERQLIRFLPDLFTPEMVYDPTVEQVAALAAEDEEATNKRIRCCKLLSALQASMVDLKRLDSGRAEAGAFRSSEPAVLESEPCSPPDLSGEELVPEEPTPTDEPASRATASPYSEEPAAAEPPPEAGKYDVEACPAPEVEPEPEPGSPYAETTADAPAETYAPIEVEVPLPPAPVELWGFGSDKKSKKKKKKVAESPHPEEAAPQEPEPDDDYGTQTTKKKKKKGKKSAWGEEPAPAEPAAEEKVSDEPV
ncbi:hypothetical protein RB600_007045 [Gaeumannomyces tritici]